MGRSAATSAATSCSTSGLPLGQRIKHRPPRRRPESRRHEEQQPCDAAVRGGADRPLREELHGCNLRAFPFGTRVDLRVPRQS
jgi:hypothetical protein